MSIARSGQTSVPSSERSLGVVSTQVRRLLHRAGWTALAAALVLMGTAALAILRGAAMTPSLTLRVLLVVLCVGLIGAMALYRGLWVLQQAVAGADVDEDGWGAMMEAAPDAIVLIDAASGLAIRENARARSLVTRVEHSGGRLGALLLDGYAQRGAEDGATTARTFEIGVAAQAEGAEEQMQAHARAVVFDARPALLCVLRDCSARTALEQELMRQRTSAEADLRAKSFFVAAMSHEIRTPLHGILGHLELLARSRLDAEQRARLRRITQSADSLLETINDTLDLASVEAGHLAVAERLFAPALLVERVALLYAPLAQGKGVDLDINSTVPTMLRVMAPQTRIEQVLRNLVSNAIKFTASGRVEIRLLQVGPERLRFEVADSGIGLDDGQRSRLFEPFVQADASIGDRFGGTGLGLSLSRQLCRLMGGDIEVESTVGVGSVFSFEVAAPVRVQPSEPPRLSGRPVIVLSRVVTWREQLARVLREAGAEVLAVAEPAELGQGGLPMDTPLVVFERNLAALQMPPGFAGQVLRVRADGPLRALHEHGQWWVSCYAIESMVSVLAQLTSPPGRLAATGAIG